MVHVAFLWIHTPFGARVIIEVEFLCMVQVSGLVHNVLTEGADSMEPQFSRSTRVAQFVWSS